MAVLQVECQAVTQVVIRKFSEMFEPGSVELLKPVRTMMYYLRCWKYVVMFADSQ